MQSATLRVAAPAASAQSRIGAGVEWSAAIPLAVPCALMLVGAGAGYAFTTDVAVARERLLGLLGASFVALLALVGLKRVERCTAWLVGAAVLAWIGAVWIIAATGPDVFRGTVGAVLNRLFAPLFWQIRVTDPIEVANTRFIVGYNGVADLCLVAIFCCAALALERSRWRINFVAGVFASAIVLAGTGARGGLTGLAAGICAIAIVLWPRRLALLAFLAAPLAILVAAVGILDKGLEFSSTAGRLTYWGDLARLLVEYPLTGVGLGLDTAFRATVGYQINPDPERVFYAHNTFVQSYLETGPLGALGMLGVPLIGLIAAIGARTRGFDQTRRPLLVAGLGVLAATEAHGLTDQVVTTNVGTLIVLLAFAAVLAALSPVAVGLAIRWTRALGGVVSALVAVVVLALVVLPQARAQALLDLGGLQLAQALSLDRQNPARPAAFNSAEAALLAGRAQDESHPAVLRDLARLHAAQFDDASAMRELGLAAQSPRLDAFDMLQIAQVYRDLGFAPDAYDWASRAYAAWGRPPEEGVMQDYARATLSDSRAQDLAIRAEAAMLARHFGDARDLFDQALTFEPNSVYLRDRVGAAGRAVAKYGP